MRYNRELMASREDHSYFVTPSSSIQEIGSLIEGLIRFVLEQNRRFHCCQYFFIITYFTCRRYLADEPKNI